MGMITLYAKQKKRHRCTEQNFGLCERMRGWDVSREQHPYNHFLNQLKKKRGKITYSIFYKYIIIFTSTLFLFMCI